MTDIEREQYAASQSQMAYNCFRAEIARLAPYSGLMQGRLLLALSALQDEMPSFTAWADAIETLKRNTP